MIMEGTLLHNNYEILELIGKGGMADVYKARHIHLSKIVAIKAMRIVSSESDPGYAERFKHEAMLTLDLRHPNIVNVHNIFEENNRIFIVMDYVSGATLRQIIKDNGPMLIDETLQILRDISSALDFIHTRGLVHRDIKSSNIIVTYKDNRPILMDFGIAKSVDSKSYQMRSDDYCGTPEYMSVEQALGEPVTKLSDIYALGVVVYEMLTGAVPFQDESSAVVMRKHITDPVPSLRKIRQEIPVEIENCVLRALSKNKEDRYQAASEFARSFYTEQRPAPDFVPPAELDESLTCVFSPDAPSEVKSASGPVKISAYIPGEEIFELEGHSDVVSSVDISSDGTKIISGSYDKTIRVWSSKTYEGLGILEGHKGWVRSVAVSPDGHSMASGGDDGRVIFWDIEKRMIQFELRSEPEVINALKFSSDGGYLAIGGNTRKLGIYSCDSRDIRMYDTSGDIIRAFAFSNDGRFSASTSGQNCSVIEIREAESGKIIQSLEDHKGQIWSLSWQRQGLYLASAGTDGIVKIWSLDTYNLLKSINNENAFIWTVMFSHDGRMIAYGSSSGKISIWSFDENREILNFEAHKGGVYSLVFSPDDNRLVSGGGDNSVKIWAIR
jgi:serine/threonine protein kinase